MAVSEGFPETRGGGGAVSRRWDWVPVHSVQRDGLQTGEGCCRHLREGRRSSASNGSWGQDPRKVVQRASDFSGSSVLGPTGPFLPRVL